MVEFPLWAWVGFAVFVIFLLALDLFVFHRNAKVVSFREAAVLSGFWISLGLLFGLFVLWYAGGEAAGEYYAGYLIEKALSVDNVFVFALIFTFFAVPAEYQYRVLFWGVVGALVMRLVFIFAGAELLNRYEWMVYIFGAFLVYTGIRMARSSNEAVDPDRNPILRLTRRLIPMTSEYNGQKFFVRERGKLLATPLVAVLIAVETTDLIFAVDSIPAIFSITTDTFVIWTSNAFAILGLRALYFMLADMIRRFVYLKFGLSVVLIFVGVKFFAEGLVGHIPIWVSLPFIATVITVSILASLYKTRGSS